MAGAACASRAAQPTCSCGQNHERGDRWGWWRTRGGQKSLEVSCPQGVERAWEVTELMSEAFLHQGHFEAIPGIPPHGPEDQLQAFTRPWPEPFGGGHCLLQTAQQLLLVPSP